MTTYVALLRAVNLGRRNKVAMADLRALFERLGAHDVTTYLQSGNVVFGSSGAAAAELTRAIEDEIRRELGLDIAVLLRTSAEMATIRSSNPFAASAERPQLHVTFLAARPAAARVRELAGEGMAPDELHVARREIYLYCQNGYGRTKLTNAYFERRLGVVATTRNWTTVTKLAELAAGAA